MLNLELIAQKQEHFDSRYFDFQSAFRYTFTLQDGQRVECSAYEHFLRGSPTALSLDISTMIGCPVKCKFCAAGAIRHIRPLNSIEMYRQVESMIPLHDHEHFPQINCSFQGIGEPSLVAADVLSSSESFLKINDRIRISIATTAVCQEAVALWGESGLPFENIQISCSAASDAKAHWLAPSLPSPKTIFRIAKWAKTFQNFKKVKVNYILMTGFNDSDSDLAELLALASDSGVVVKISTLNSTDTSRQFSLMPADIERARTFSEALSNAGIESYVYGAFQGTSISCGQLIFDNHNRRNR